MVHSGTGPENIAARTSGTVTDLFNQFMREKEAFDESNYREKFLNGSYNGKVVGHYSQIVWASNTKLGCGLADCSGKGSYKLFLVCRYQTGNTIGREVYALGDTSSTSTEQTGTIEDTKVFAESPADDSSSGKSLKEFCFTKYGLWFLSSLLSYFLLNGIFDL